MSTPRRYRKKPVEIEAMLLDGTPPELHSVYLWVEGHIGSVLPPGFDDGDPRPGVTIDPADGAFVIRTLEGDMKASRGDWIIRGVQGEFYPCKADIFDASYQEVQEP